MESICHQMQIEAYETFTCYTGLCSLYLYLSIFTLCYIFPMYFYNEGFRILKLLNWKIDQKEQKHE